MKIRFICLLSMMVLSAAAGEREDLLRTFARDHAAAESTFQNAMTTVDLTGSAGNLWQVAKSHYFKALDYKLRHTDSLQERMKLLGNSHKFCIKVWEIKETPREGQGSLIGMQIYHRMALLYQQQTAVLMLEGEAEKRWKRIAGATLCLKTQTVQLEDGCADFSEMMYGRKIPLEITLFPKDTFHFKGRDFAVIRTDMPFSMNDDFSTVYLCELKKDKLFIFARCGFPLISRWEVQGDCLIFHDGDEKQNVKLR